MKKYILKKDGKEVKKGDVLDVMDVTVDDALLDYLANKGFVEVKEVKEDPLKPYIRRIARKLNLSYPVAVDFLEVVAEVSPLAALNILLTQIANVFNKDKEIKDYNMVWVLGSNGKVVSSIHNNVSYKTVPVFTSKEDIYKAIELVSGLYEAVYGKQKGN